MATTSYGLARKSKQFRKAKVGSTMSEPPTIFGKERDFNLQPVLKEVIRTPPKELTTFNKAPIAHNEENYEEVPTAH